MMPESKNTQKILITAFLSVSLIGIIFRFYKITANQFFFYDEGLYLNLNRKFLTIVEHNFPQNFQDFFRTLEMLWYLSLGTGKAFWIFLPELRVYFLGMEAWYFARVPAAIFGTLTLGVVFLLAKRYFNSLWIGLLSAAILAIFPSHVYYSRLGMQETMSSFFFITSIYLYLYPPQLGFRTFLSGFFLACVYFSNYRMIIAPIFIIFMELYTSIASRKDVNYRKLLWHTLTFFTVVIFIGSSYGARNFSVTLPWMFYQQQLSEGHFNLLNFLSYPFYIFYLEGFFLGVIFFGNIYFLARKKWHEGLFFSLVCLAMAVFCLPLEKAARYIGVVMPLIAIASASLIVFLWGHFKTPAMKMAVRLLTFLVLAQLLINSFFITSAKNDYEASLKFILSRDRKALVLSTQHWIQRLYVRNPDSVQEAPHSFNQLLNLYLQGYRYLVIDVQAYISFTKDKKHFSLPLEDHLEFISRYVTPIKEFPHFNKLMVKRFVAEHNQDLQGSLAFLNQNTDGHLGALRIYDLRDCIKAFQQKLTK